MGGVGLVRGGRAERSRERRGFRWLLLMLLLLLLVVEVAGEEGRD